MINNGPVNEPTKARRSINLAAPFRGAGWTEKDQMFKAEQRLRFAVSVLLFQKRPQREPAMMPHERGWAESNDATGLLEPPAKIDIVTGFVVFGIETADIFKCQPMKRHITTGNVLGDCICEQNVTGSTRRCCHAGLDPILRGWSHIRTACSRVIAAHEGAD